MSSTLSRMSLAVAEERAAEFCELIEGQCEQLYIAGSVRRRSPTVGDIEIVAEPILTDLLDMFGEVVGQVDTLDVLLGDLLSQGFVRKRGANGTTAWGPKHKRIVWEDTPIDLFCADEKRFGLILLIRTGPAAYSHQIVTPKGQRTNDGRPGLLPPHLRVQGGWLTYRTSGERLETPHEDDVYRLLGLPYVAPEHRR